MVKKKRVEKTKHLNKYLLVKPDSNSSSNRIYFVDFLYTGYTYSFYIGEIFTRYEWESYSGGEWERISNES